MKKTALITGASSGTGLEFARLFAKDGHNVVLVARSGDKLQALATELEQQYKVRALAISKDLSDSAQIEALYSELKAQQIEIDFLVNNAGFGDYAFFADAEWSKLQQMLDVNIAALTHLSHLFVQDMKRRGSGHILNIASTAAFQPGPSMAVYCATKAYVLSLGEAMWSELKGTGVQVTNYCPGAFASGFQDVADLHDSKFIKGKKLPTSAEVAAYGYRQMKAGKMTTIYGWMNALMAFSVRLSPRKWVLAFARSLMGK